MDAIVGEGDDTAAELPPEVVDTGLICLVILARFRADSATVGNDPPMSRTERH